MNKKIIALFGASEKGVFEQPYYCQDISQLLDWLGNPPPDTHALYYAIQTLLYEDSLFFFRVREEGFSVGDYLRCLKLLEAEHLINETSALCLPGVGDQEILNATLKLCDSHNQILITNEADLYDYLTAA
ncbi:MAG: hypothetical protein KDK65_03025 [Chlamydiia bacterium]|nr:hypothetical protein [Chlamydiia bacterium]